MIDDCGNRYVPVGAPGSIERVKVQYPKLIKIYRARFGDQDYNDLYAHDDLERQDGFTSRLERESIIFAAKEVL